MNTNKPAFVYLRTKFPRLSEAKIKEGIFVGRQIKDIFKVPKPETLLNHDKKQVWDSILQVCINFFGKVRSEYYKDLVNGFISEIWRLRILKTIFLRIPPGFLPCELPKIQ